MTIRTFWTILIKILGIWLVLDSITVVPQFFSTFLFTVSSNTLQDFALAFVLLLLTIGIYLFILRLFVFKTSWLIDRLHLDKGFTEERIDLTIQQDTVLTIATVVIGGLIFVDSLPQLCKQVFISFQEKTSFRENPSSVWVIFHLIQTFSGYWLMTNSKRVVAFINKKVQNDNV